MQPSSHGWYKRHSLSNSIHEYAPLNFISLHILFQHRLARLLLRLSSHRSDTHIATQHTRKLCARYPHNGSVALFNRALTPAFMERQGIFGRIKARATCDHVHRSLVLNFTWRWAPTPLHQHMHVSAFGLLSITMPMTQTMWWSNL